MDLDASRLHYGVCANLSPEDSQSLGLNCVHVISFVKTDHRVYNTYDKRSNTYNRLIIHIIGCIIPITRPRHKPRPRHTAKVKAQGQVTSVY